MLSWAKQRTLHSEWQCHGAYVGDYRTVFAKPIVVRPTCMVIDPPLTIHINHSSVGQWPFGSCCCLSYSLWTNQLLLYSRCWSAAAFIIIIIVVVPVITVLSPVTTVSVVNYSLSSFFVSFILLFPHFPPISAHDSLQTLT